jgi:hypothetical protein
VYARRVKEFTLKHADNDVAQSLYVQLAQFRPQPFPALEIFRCLSVTPSLSQLSLFISPTIKTVELSGCAADNIHIVDPFLSSLTNNPWFSTTELRHLILRGQATTATTVPFISFRHLQSLDIVGELDLASLKEFGGIPRLENLVVTLSRSVTGVEGDIGFAQLKMLHITATFSLIHAMLELIATVQLERVTLVVCTPVPVFQRVCDTSTQVEGKSSVKKKKGCKKSVISEKSCPQEALPCDTWASCMAELSSRWSASLISITLCLDKSTDSKKSIPQGFRLFSDVRPFARVEHMHLIDCHFEPSDEEIRELALACPELRELRLSVGGCVRRKDAVETRHYCSDLNCCNDERMGLAQATSSPHTTTTIEALWALTESCRHLKNLEIGLDLGYIPPFSPTTIFSHGLERLSVGSLESRHGRPSRELLKVGRHLDRLFPHLQCVETHAGYSPDDWKQIYEIIQMYQDVRMDDRKRQGFIVQSW